jgi:PAS domain S-box-containing protein
MMKILIIDDNADFLAYMEKKLREAGHEVATETDGLSAIRRLVDYTPDIIFTDYFLPTINGDILCRIVRKMDHLDNTYLVLMSAAAQELQLDPSGVSANFLIAKGTFKDTLQHFLSAMADAEKSGRDDHAQGVAGIESLRSRQMIVELLGKYRHLQLMLDSISEGIVEVYRGQIVYVNPAAVMILDRQEHELLGAYPSALFEESERPKIEGMLKSTYGESVLTTWKTTTQPEDRTLSVRKLLLHGDQDTVIILVTDVTERARAEEALGSYKNHLEALVEERTAELKSAGEKLNQAQKMEAVGTLAGGVAHDFNNILTVIMGSANLMQMNTDKDDVLRPHIDQIIASSERAADLTRSLLAFSRKQHITLEPHDVNGVVLSTAKLLTRLLPEDIELTMHLAENDTFSLLDVTQISQVLMNLATNARDAMPHGGSLTITTERVVLDETFEGPHGTGKPGEYLRLSVSDTGTGMDEETTKRIFEPFFTTKGVGKGTGLGLASAYGIVKQHDGFIAVSSVPLMGSTFDVYLPLTETPAPQKAPASGEPKKGTETILVAEDDRDVRGLLTDILESHGYTTIEAVDGDDAIRLHQEHKDKVDLIILDVVMPGKNGKEALDEITRTNPFAKAIFVSGYTGDVVIDKGIESESVDFLQKPITVTELLGKVREVLDRQ